jgi:hypothetical protein
MKRKRHGSADQFPNRTLSIAISRDCSVKGCDNHGLISRSVNGQARVRCIEHNGKTKSEETAELLKAIGF